MNTIDFIVLSRSLFHRQAYLRRLHAARYIRPIYALVVTNMQCLG